MENNMTPELMRELGKAYLFNKESDKERRNQGIELLLKAQTDGDPEAEFIVARLILAGVLKPSGVDPIDHALGMLCRSAGNGCVQARSMLNSYCEFRYDKEFGGLSENSDNYEGLVDFDGNPIRIDRTGVFTPIDAELERRNGENVLQLSLNVKFLYYEDLEDTDAFEDAVLRGIREWEGNYEVFGGQKIKVEVVITTEDRIYDNVIVLPLTGELGDTLKSVSDAIATKTKKKEIDDILTNKRSFAVSGIKWTVNSRKIIYIQSRSGRFDDLEEIKHVSKHEFGHALGLGDLYECRTDRLDGVEAGTYKELDSYYINNRIYNLVMCDHHGIISNNDIEMVILAFRENKMQHYQPGKIKGKISAALGKGN